MNEKTISAGNLQQQLGSLFGARDIISWDLYDEDDKEYLVRKIELLIPNVDDATENAQRENVRLDKLRATIVTALWNQNKYYGGKLLMSIQYVICTKETEKPEDAINETEYTVYPMFRVRKCCNKDNSTNCCMIYVDDNGRVYQNWADYKQNNTLPRGVLVAPKNGYYNFDEKDRVLLECMLTPASGFLSRAGNVASKTAGVLGVGAATVTLTALTLPISAPVLAGAAIVGVGAGLWNAGAAAMRLFDRGNHEEPINLKDSKSRSDWIGVAGGVVTLGAGGATAALSEHAALGQRASEVLVGAVSGLNIATIAISGVGVGNGIFEIILKRVNEEEVSALDVAQLGSSLFLLTHSVYNYETASRIVTACDDRTVLSTRKELAKQQRRLLDRARDQIFHLLGSKESRMDVIRALNNMPDSKHIDHPVALDKSLRMQIVNRVIDTLGHSATTAASDLDLLEDTIDNITIYVTDPDAIDKLSRIARDYYLESSEEISRQLCRFVPSEEVLWVAFKIAYKLCDGQEVSDFINSVNEGFLMRKLQSYYNKLIPKLGESRECKVCQGSYNISATLQA